MSPSRGRKQFVPARPRAEVITAIAVGASIAIGAILLIWLIRPGPQGVPGKGGLLSRQPRMTLLVLSSAAAIGGVVLLVRRRRRQPRLGLRGSIALGSALVIVAAIVGGFFWPGGVVRHWPKQPKIADVAPTNSLSVPSSTPAATGPKTTAKTGTTVRTATTVQTPTTVTPTTKAR